MLSLKPLNIITGNYGSGKTEIALNMAFMAKKAGNSVVIADLDIVNPYFRTNDVRVDLKSAGIDLVAPVYASTNVDIPALPAEVAKCFNGTFDVAVLDVGGDPEGAVALSVYKKEIIKLDYEMYFVININRPDTANCEDIVKLIQEVEASSGLRVTALINNTNLLRESKTGDILKAQEILAQVTKTTGIEVRFIASEQKISDQLNPSLSELLFPLNLYLKLPFED